MVSIIIPCYNNSKILYNNMLPILYQQSNCEIILINDNEKNSKEYELINNLKSIYKVIDTDDKNNRSNVRNIGANISTGDILIFIDGDTIPVSTFMELILKNINNKNIVFGNRINIPVNMVDNLNFFIHHNSLSIYGKKDIDWRYASSNCFACLKEDWLKTGGFDENFKGWGYEDTELFYRFYKNNIKFIILNELITFHVPHSENFLQRLTNSNKNFNYFLNKHPELIRDKLLFNRQEEILDWCLGMYIKKYVYTFLMYLKLKSLYAKIYKYINIRFLTKIYAILIKYIFLCRRLLCKLIY